MTKAWLTCCAATLICSCRPALVNLPALPDCPKPIAPAVIQCPTLALLDPIPKVIHIDIAPGKVEADAGGEQLLRNYAAIRQAIKAWQK
jgi:hypothetical protein